MISLLQVGRAVAALMVVLFHAELAANAYSNAETRVFSFGWSGVQFFFVLSGFIIYTVHARDVGRPDRVGDYLKKRLLRIYPVYLFVTLALAPVWLFGPALSEPYYRDLGALVRSALLIPQAHPPHLAVAWTLTHELMFYLIFAAWLIDRRGIWLLIAWFAAVAIANLIDTPAFPLNYPLSANNLLFGLGMIAAGVANRVRVGAPVLLAGVGLFVTTAALVNVAPTALPGAVLILLFGFASFLVVLTSTNPAIEGFASKRKWLNFVGDSSYSIYLVHFPAVSAACKILVRLGIGSGYLLFIGSVAAGIASGIVLHLAVERPILRRFGRQRSNPASR